PRPARPHVAESVVGDAVELVLARPRRGVVGDDDLEVVEALGRERVEAPADELRPVARGEHDGEPGAARTGVRGHGQASVEPRVTAGAVPVPWSSSIRRNTPSR